MVAPEKLSTDRFLDGKVMLQQPESGYRAGIDPVLLAAAVPAAGGEKVLDLGCGVGAAALCLAARVADVVVEGVDIQSNLVRLARENAGLSGLAARARFQSADILTLSLGQIFDHVMANPPYVANGAGTVSPDPAKALANMEGEAVVTDWIAAALAHVVDGGSITFIHRYDRREEVVAGLSPACGDIVSFPLWADPGRKRAKRVIVHARKGGDGPPRESDGLVLHGDDGSYTSETEAILRDAAALTL